MKNMTIEAIAEACNGTIHNIGKNEDKITVCATSVVIDSRKVTRDGIFIATVGARVDGHDFIRQIFEKGALAAVCEKLPQDIDDGGYGVCILVEDSFVALKKIAAYYRQQLDCKVIGITGSVGKTSTKEIIASVVSKRYVTHKTQGNFNNEVGVPLTVLECREDTEVLVLEMGINHFGEMDRLSKIGRPDVMVITNIGECHLEFLGDRDGVLRAKTECFTNMNPDGLVFLNGDDDKLAKVAMVHGRKPVFFGLSGKKDYYATDIETQGLLGIKATLHSQKGYELAVTIPIPGMHMVYNALSALAIGDYLAIDRSLIAQGIEEVQALGGRSNIIRTDKFTVIDDCYNANPTSMEAAIKLLMRADGLRVAILGDMFELGEDEAALHEKVGRMAASSDIDMIIFIGELSLNMYNGAKSVRDDGVYYYKTVDEAMGKLKCIVPKQASVLVKASHSMGFDRIVGLLTGQDK